MCCCGVYASINAACSLTIMYTNCTCNSNHNNNNRNNYNRNNYNHNNYNRSNKDVVYRLVCVRCGWSVMSCLRI